MVERVGKSFPHLANLPEFPSSPIANRIHDNGLKGSMMVEYTIANPRHVNSEQVQNTHCRTVCSRATRAMCQVCE